MDIFRDLHIVNQMKMLDFQPRCGREIDNVLFVGFIKYLKIKYILFLLLLRPAYYRCSSRVNSIFQALIFVDIFP